MSTVVSIPGFYEPFGSMLHLLAAGVFAILGGSLVLRSRERIVRVTLAIFVLATMVMLALSGTYHLLDDGTTGRAVLRRLDHAAIWTMIAASFTAIHGVAFRGRWRWAFITGVWAVAIPALVLEVVFFTSFPEILILSLYLAMGWLGVVSALVLLRRYGRAVLRDLVGGGLAYSMGALYDFMGGPSPWPGVIGPHEVFHVAVVLGVALHWRFIHGLVRSRQCGGRWPAARLCHHAGAHARIR